MYPPLSAGQIAGVQTAVHVVQDVFQYDETEAALLVDATNTFNTLNRAAALYNIRFICPSLSTILINIYRAPTQLFVDGESLLSQEGTTQLSHADVHTGYTPSDQKPP